MTDATTDTPTTAAAEAASGGRDRFIDAVRAGALLVVVFGHWLATLPRVHDGTTVANDHLLAGWEAAGLLTWLLQVVPLFVMVSAAVASASAHRARDAQLRWWSRRALRLARPTATYLFALTALWLVAQLRVPVGVFSQMFSGSLTVHLWFIVMLLAVQALLPASVAAHRRFGLSAVGGLVLAALFIDLARSGFAVGPHIGADVATAAPALGWLNVVVVWLVPQQLGVAWKHGALRGRRASALLLGLGALWLLAATQLGYPVAMVGADPLTGASNVVPPTAALLGVVAVQAALVLLLEVPARGLLQRSGRLWSAVKLLAALGMPLYLWHKLAELPALWLANRLGLTIDAGLPGDPGFWSARLLWLALCSMVVVPLVIAVIAFEHRRRREVPLAMAAWRLWLGGALTVAATTWALSEGLSVAPPAFVALFAGSMLLGDRRRQDPAPSD